jgi:hypothetical protein
VTLPSGTSAASSEQNVTFHDAVGSWFGRAVPVPGETICPPGSAGCPVPLEIIMQFTISEDGTMNAIDSNIFGALHTPAHSQWEPAGQRSVRAAFTLMLAEPRRRWFPFAESARAGLRMRRDARVRVARRVHIRRPSRENSITKQGLGLAGGSGG